MRCVGLLLVCCSNFQPPIPIFSCHTVPCISLPIHRVPIAGWLRVNHGSRQLPTTGFCEMGLMHERDGLPSVISTCQHEPGEHVELLERRTEGRWRMEGESPWNWTPKCPPIRLSRRRRRQVMGRRHYRPRHQKQRAARAQGHQLRIDNFQVAIGCRSTNRAQCSQVVLFVPSTPSTIPGTEEGYLEFGQWFGSQLAR
ncbi:hypothetical protein B0T19DRAFT_415801 [Cercophora scortea]|uniref:Uncharacterized protein n=1 Tax=Cercophora scortea TaxID=314031 RepID=A0AAE0MIP0_9PEZI|nr:hypothetical protein B0T19DRAFT_415801 [Cercophora scortea]